MRTLIPKFASTVLLSATIGCVRTAPQPSLAYWLSSDSSQYSPVVRLRVATARDGSSLTVLLDSGVIAVPGSFTAESPVMMRNLYLTAYIAASNTTPIALVRESPAPFADRRGWKVVAQSDSALVVDALRFGEAHTVRSPPLRVRNAPAAAASYWLVLGISGEFVDLRVRYDERGSGMHIGTPRDRRVQVYACSARDLAGLLDTARSSGMRRAYGLLC